VDTHEEYGSVLDNRPRHEAVEKGRPISGVLGTADSCTVTGPLGTHLGLP
jgi:hypothetical protein